MKIDLNSRWGRWFLHSLWLDETRWSYKYDGKTTNLCTFMRVCLFWGPLKYALVIGAIFYALFVTIIIPYMAVGFLMTLLIWVAALACIAAILGVSYCIIKTLEYYQINRDNEKPILIQWLAAKKEKICPLVEFTNGLDE